MDYAWRGHRGDAGDIPKPHLGAGFSVQHHVLDVVEVLPDLWTSPDHDIEHLLLLKQAAYGDATGQRRCIAADVTGLEAKRAGFVQIDFDVDRLLFGLWLDLRVLDPVDLCQDPLDLLCLGAEDVEIFAVYPDRDRLVFTGYALAHPLGEEGL